VTEETWVDGVLRRAIDKWLRADVPEGRLSRPSEGTPQGGVISPSQSGSAALQAENTVLRRTLDELVRAARDYKRAVHHPDTIVNRMAERALEAALAKVEDRDA